MIVDIAVLVVVVLSLLIALVRGLIREVLTILGVFGGLLAAYFGGPLLSPHIQNLLGASPGTEGEEPAKLFDMVPYSIVGDALAYGSIFIAVVIILSLVSHLLAESAKSLGFGILDKILGGLFGLARGILLVAFMYLPFYLVVDAETRKQWTGDSQTFPYLEMSGEAIASHIPEDTKERVASEADRFKETVKEHEQVKEIVKQVNGAGEESMKETGSDGASSDTDSDPGQLKKDIEKMFKENFDNLDEKPAGESGAQE